MQTVMNPPANPARDLQMAVAQKEQASARVQDILNKQDVNPEIVQRGVKLIQRSVKEATNWTNELFNLIRSADELHIAWGSLVTAESRAVEWFRGMIKQEDPDYKGKITNLQDIAKYNGDKQLSYSVTKSKIKGLIDSADQLCADLQEWWNFQAKHDGQPHKALPDGYLNIHSKRYEDPRKGSTLFMRDAREAQGAAGMLTARKAQMDREAAKRAASETGTNGDQTNAPTEGVRQNNHLPAVILEAQNILLRAIQDCYEEIGEDAWVANKLNSLATEMRELVAAKRKDLSDKATEHAKRPSAAVANETKQDGNEGDSKNDLPDVTEDDAGEVQEESVEDKANIMALGDDMAETGTGR